MKPSYSKISLLAATSLFFATGSLYADFEVSQFETDEQVKKSWHVLADDAAGGKTQANVLLNEDGNLEFSGVFVPWKNGCFAQLRSNSLPRGAGVNDVVNIKFRGDGARYRITLVIWSQGEVKKVGKFRKFCQTKANEWATLSIKLEEMEWRVGEEVVEAPVTTEGAAFAMDVMGGMTDEQEETLKELPFKFEIKNITLTKNK